MIDPSYYTPLARAAEAAGYSSIGLADSICYPKDSGSTYPYTVGGTRQFLENKPFIEPLVCASAMGAVTNKIRFHTAVLKLPIRHPVILAKQVTSVSAMTGGRFDLGVGTSPWPDDYQVCGIPWRDRGRRLEECIDVISKLSTGSYVEHHGRFYDFPPIRMNPEGPFQIFMGGNSDISLERAARLADGWLPVGLSLDDLAAALKKITEHRSRYGRADTPFVVHAACGEASSADGVRRLAELGVTHAVGGMSSFNPYGVTADNEPLQAKIDALNRYSEQVIAVTADVDPAPL